jgi:hypothetical protein
VTPSDERRSKRIRLLIWGGGTFAVIVAAAGVFVWKAWF